MRRGAARRLHIASNRENDILRRTRILFALTALLLVAASALPARASWMVPGSPYRAKDFAIVQHDGLYHLFYIRHNWNLPTAETEKDFGHAVSRDLWNWTQLAPVLPVRDSSWDRTHVWAPSIVEKDGVFYMFYTGVATGPGSQQLWQRIGVATSTDLMEWTRYDEPLLSCLSLSWTFCDSTTEQTTFRDPFVMPDPARPGHWLMYYAANYGLDPAAMLTGMAESEDLLHWNDLGPQWATYRGYTNDWILESPHVFQHGDRWWLFYTTSGATALQYVYGSDPTGPVETWTGQGTLTAMLGLDTSAWYASEFLREGLVEYYAYVIADRIDVKRMVWAPDGRTFQLVQPDLMHVKGMTWDAAQVLEGDTATLAIRAVNPAAGAAHLEALRVRPDGSLAPVALAALGLPATVTLTGDTTRIAWAAAWLPDSSETSGTMPLLVRLTDQTQAAAVLPVVARPLALGPLAWDRDTVADDSTATLAVPAVNWQHRSVTLAGFRLLPDTALALSSAVLGLPASLPLTGDTTRFVWRAHWTSGPPDSGAVLDLRVRVAGEAAPVIAVLPPPPLEITALAWDRDTVAIDSPATLSIAALHWRDRYVALEALRLEEDSTFTPLPLDSLGLPAVVALTADTTRLAWTGVWLRGGPDTTRALRLVLRAPGGGVAAPAITVPAPPPLEVLALAWDRDTVPDDSLATLALVARHWEGRAALLETWRLLGDTARVALRPDSLGLPAVVALTGDTTRVAWAARWLRDGPDTTISMRLLVRTADSTAAAPPLTILCPPVYRVLGLAWDRDTVPADSLARLAIVAEHWTGQVVGLDPWRMAGDSSLVPVAPDSLGLPAAVPLVADTTWVPWAARWLRDGPDTTRALRLVVRLADSVATAPALTVLPPPPLVVAALAWDRDTVPDDGAATLAIVAQGWPRRAVRLEAFRVRPDSTRVATAPDSLGLAEFVALTGDTTRVPWTARWLRDGPDTTIAMRLEVRVSDGSAVAPVLTVLCPPVYRLTALAWDRDSVADDSLVHLAIVAENWTGQTLRLAAWRLADDGSTVVAPLDSLGLAAAVPLTADTTRVAWTARWLRYGADSARALRLVAGLPDSAVLAPVLTVRAPPPLVLTAMGWDSLLVREGSTVTLWIAAAGVRGRAVAFEAYRAVEDTILVPLALADLGLPAQVPLTADTTRVPWTALWLPDGADSSRALHLRVGIAGATLAAAPLVVLGLQLPPAGVGGPPVTVGRDALEARREGTSWSLAVRLVRALETVRVDLYDTQGRRVRRLHDGPLPGGVTLLRWDGRNETGSSAASGIYFARLVSARFSATTRLLRLR